MQYTHIAVAIVLKAKNNEQFQRVKVTAIKKIIIIIKNALFECQCI